MTNASAAFELTFWGTVSVRHRRNHATLEAARAEATRVLNKMSNRRAHPAVIYSAGSEKPVASVF